MYNELSDDEDFDELDAVQFRVKSRSKPSAAEDPGDQVIAEPPAREGGQGQEPPAAEEEPEEEEEEEYEVERILNKRIKKGKVEYLVKWKGKNVSQPKHHDHNCSVQVGTYQNITHGKH